MQIQSARGALGLQAPNPTPPPGTRQVGFTWGPFPPTALRAPLYHLIWILSARLLGLGKPRLRVLGVLTLHDFAIDLEL